jgi:hypothetical protein
MRDDIHRPSAIKVEEYFAIGYVYLSTPQYSSPDFAIWNGEEKRRIHELVTRNGWRWSHHEHGGTCGICGASANYVGVFVHQPTGQVIYVGHICASKVEMGDNDAFDALKRRIRAEQERYRGTLKARDRIHEYGIPELECGQFAHHILADMWGKLVKYGSLSEKQVKFAKRLIDEAKSPKPAPKAEEPTPTEAAPEGRVVVTGVILGLKRVDSIYGETIKMLVRSDVGGWKVWSTRPAALAGVEKGAHIQFTATLKQSPKDEYFAFASRPSKARIVSTPAPADS